MNALKAFTNSLKWTFSKQNYAYLIEKEGASLAALKENIKNLFDSFRHCYGREKYDLSLPFMQINSAGGKTDAPLERYLLSKAQEMTEKLEQAQERVKDKFFPSYKGKIRIDRLAEEIVKARIFCADSEDYKAIKDFCFCAYDLEQEEREDFDGAFIIAKCKVFCALLQQAERGENKPQGEELAALLFDYQNGLQGGEWSERAEKAFYKGKKLSAQLYYGGKSKITYGGQPFLYQEDGFEGEGAVNYLFTERDNLVLHSFKLHKFSQDLFMFSQAGKGLKINCKTFYKENSEIRLFEVENLYKTNRKFKLKLNALPYLAGAAIYEEININGAKGVRFGKGDKDFYMCFSLPYQSKCALYANGASARYTAEFSFKLKRQEKIVLKTAVTIAQSLQEAAAAVEKTRHIDFYKCISLFDQRGQTEDIQSLPTESFYALLKDGAPLPLIKYIKAGAYGQNKNFLLDEWGRAATLQKGYLTKPQGEQIYLLYNGKAVRLTGGIFTKTPSGGEFFYEDSTLQAKVTLSHAQSKSYRIELNWEKPCEAQLLFVFEFKKHITFEKCERGFVSGACEISLSAQAESFTCLKANYDKENALLYADGKLQRSDFLAFTCAVTQDFELTLSPAVETINYSPIFDKNPYAQKLYSEAKKILYLYSNDLAPLSALTLNACAYASLDFLKEYLIKLKKECFISCNYYDACAVKKISFDNYAFALSLFNYTLLSGDKSLYANEDVKDFLNKILFTPPEDNFKAEALLLLVKAAELTPRNSPILLAAEDLINGLTAQEKRKAELIGALKLQENTEQYLFSLLGEFPQVPPCYAYITLFSSLYGIKLNAPLLYAKPQENYRPLPLCVNFFKKSYYLDFQRGNPSLKLNNLIMLPSLDCSNVHKGENSITVYH